MARPLQVSLLGGSLGSLILRGVEELAATPTVHLVWPELPPREPLDSGWQLDGPGILLGICIGLSLGPLIRICLARTCWTSFVPSQIRILAAQL